MKERCLIKPYLFQHYTREELTRKARSGYGVVIPLAATEQHGPHLAVNTDSMICDHISQRAIEKATKTGEVRLLLAPMLAVGISEHHLVFGGTLSYTPETYFSMLKDLGDSLVKIGFKKIIFLNAHGGNEYMMHQASQYLAVKYPIWTASGSYWNVARDAFQEANASEIGMVPGHAGGFETSLMLAMASDLVRSEFIEEEHPPLKRTGGIPRQTFLGHHGELTGVDGYTDSAKLSDGEKGKKYLDVAVHSVAEWLVNLYKNMKSVEMERT